MSFEIAQFPAVWRAGIGEQKLQVMWFDVFFRGPHLAGVRVRAATEKVTQTALRWFSGVTHAQVKKRPEKRQEVARSLMHLVSYF